MHNKKILIAVPTYKRNKRLKVLFDLLKNSKTKISVFDNSENQEAKKIVQNYSHEYIHVNKKGLSHVRNSILEHGINNNFDYIYMFDDDEIAYTENIEKMLKYAIETEADIVCGPVKQIIENRENNDIDLNAFRTKRRPTNTKMTHCATNNILIKVSSIENLRFNNKYNQTGGEDTDFTSRMTKKGKIILWNDETPVYEIVDKKRLNKKWLFNRARQIGFCTSSINVMDKSKPYFIVNSIVRLVYAFFLFLLSFLNPQRNITMKTESYKFFGNSIGIIEGVFGIRKKNY